MQTTNAHNCVAGRSQLEGYRRSISACVAQMDLRPRHRGGFDWNIAEQQVGALQILQIHSDPILLQRSLRCIQADQRTHYIVGLNLSGRTSVHHDDGTVDIPPNAFFFLDKALPYETVFHGPTDRILVCMPRQQLDRRLHDPSRYRLTVSPALTGTSRVAADYLRSLVLEAAQIAPGQQMQAAEICLDLLVMALDAGQDSATAGSVPLRAGQWALLSRIKTFARCRLSDPELSPGAIAEAHAISKRYLHALFAASGTTLGTWVREERLGRARACLTDRRLDQLSVTEIALRQGFNDIPHFSRQFKTRYGLSPTALRNYSRVTQGSA